MTGTVQGSAAKEISRGCVAIVKEHVGRGPTKVRVTIDEDKVVILYEDSLTLVEKKLAADGDPDFVRLMRRKFQDAVRPEVVALVEGVLGRTARTFLSDHDVVNDVGLEVIVLDEIQAPIAAPQAPRGE